MIKIAILLCFFKSGLAYSSERFIQKELPIGTAIQHRFPSDSHIRVSKKGMIDLLWQGNDTWRITTLKSGFVLLRAINNSGEETQRVLLTIKKIPKPAFLTNSSYQKAMHFSCQEPGIQCDQNAGTIKGTTDDWSFYHKSKQLCRKAPPCKHKMKLSAKGMEAMSQDIKSFVAREAKINFSSQGSVQILVPCEKSTLNTFQESIESLIDSTGANGKMNVKCMISSTSSYQLKATIFYLKEAEAEGLGILSPTSWSLNRTRWESVSAFLKKNKERIISSPIFHLLAGETFEVTTGGEIYFPSQGENTTSHWKPFGLLFNGSVKPISQETHEFSYQLELKLPTGNGSSMHGSQLKSKSIVTINKPTIVGEVNAQFYDQQESEIPVIRKVPIIGPLLTHSESSHSNSRMYLSIVLQKLATEGNHIIQ